MVTRRARGRLREEILEAADRLLIERGDAHDVSIELIVEAVGCTPPALYYYFVSKEQLLSEVCERQFRRFADQLECSIPMKADPIAELLARGHAYLDWAVAHPEHYRVLFMTVTGRPPDGETQDPSEGAGMAELIDNISRAMSAGRLPPGDHLQIALALWSTVHGMASLCVVNPSLPLEDAHAVVEFTARAVLESLGRHE